jgi:hypothetical protein
MLAAVDRWASDNDVSRSKAVRDLIELGLGRANARSRQSRN